MIDWQVMAVSPGNSLLNDVKVSSGDASVTVAVFAVCDVVSSFRVTPSDV